MSKLVHTVFLPENWDQSISEETDVTNLDIDGSGEEAGLSFSFPLSEHTGVSLRNLLNMIYTYGPLLNRAIPSRFYVSFTLIDFLTGQQLTGSEGVAEIRKMINGGGGGVPIDETVLMSGIKLTDDTVCINGFAPLNRDDDSEPDEREYMESCRQLSEAMNRCAISSTRIQAKKLQTDNDKYVLHMWLARLGMKGPDYKTARKVLMQNLEGVMAHKAKGQSKKSDGRTNKTQEHKSSITMPEVREEETGVSDIDGMDIEVDGKKAMGTGNVAELNNRHDKVVVQDISKNDAVSATEQTVETVAAMDLLPSETLVQIAAIDNITEIEELKSAAQISIEDMEKQSVQLERSVAQLDLDIKSIKDRIGGLREELAKKQTELGNVQAGLAEIKQNRILKMQELDALDKQGETINAKRLFDAFIAAARAWMKSLASCVKTRMHSNPQ